MSLELDIRHDFGGFTLQAQVLAPTGVTALFGRSGSGKTSLINAVAGILTPDSGRIVLNGRVLFDSKAAISIPVHKRRIGYVFQEARLFPHLTVLQNITYAQRFTRQSSCKNLDQIMEILGLAALLSRLPSGLSGGEAQRVAIGRALLSDPQLLLMDEPLAALDEARKAEIFPYLEALRDHAKIPIVYVSHALPEVARLATTLVILEGGRVRRDGPLAEVLADPDAVPDLGVREAGAVLPVEIAAHEADGLTRVTCSAGAIWLPQITGAVGHKLRLRISAQDVILSRNRPEGLSALNILPCEVTALRLGDGPGALLQLRAGQDLLLARVTRRSVAALELQVGDACFAILKSVAIAKADVGH